MPDVSHTIKVSPDGRFVFAAGTYKPFIKCYEVENLALKFQRGLDADVIKIQMLSDDFSKVCSVCHVVKNEWCQKLRK